MLTVEQMHEIVSYQIFSGLHEVDNFMLTNKYNIGNVIQNSLGVTDYH